MTWPLSQSHMWDSCPINTALTHWEPGGARSCLLLCPTRTGVLALAQHLSCWPCGSLFSSKANSGNWWGWSPTLTPCDHDYSFPSWQSLYWEAKFPETGEEPPQRRATSPGLTRPLGPESCAFPSTSTRVSPSSCQPPPCPQMLFDCMNYKAVHLETLNTIP